MPGINIDIEAPEVGANDLHGSLNVGHFRYGNKYGRGGGEETRDLADGRHHFLRRGWDSQCGFEDDCPKQVTLHCCSICDNSVESFQVISQ